MNAGAGIPVGIGRGEIVLDGRLSLLSPALDQGFKLEKLDHGTRIFHKYPVPKHFQLDFLQIKKDELIERPAFTSRLRPNYMLG